MTKSMYDNVFDKKCAVCGSLYKADIYLQGECPNCGWENGILVEENEDRVIGPNMVSLNKAKELYKQGKPRIPDIDDFMGMLFFYGEVQFAYKGIMYGVVFEGRANNEEIVLFEADAEVLQTFKTKEEFIKNAKVQGKFVKDIWDKVTDIDWLQ